MGAASSVGPKPWKKNARPFYQTPTESQAPGNMPVTQPVKTTTTIEPPAFASLPSTFFHQLTNILVSDNDLQTLSRLNATCTAIKEETDAALLRRVVFGGKYEWAERFGLGRGRWGMKGLDAGFVRVKACVREIHITDTTSVPSSTRNQCWNVLSSFPNLERLEYKATYGSQAQDLFLFPRKGIIFPKLKYLSMKLLDVDDQQYYQIDRDPYQAEERMLEAGLIKHYIASVGGMKGLEARKSIGLSMWYKTLNTDFPAINLEDSFPVINRIHIRCGTHDSLDMLKQSIQPGSRGMDRGIDIDFEAVRGGSMIGSQVVLKLFRKCEHLHIRSRHHQITSVQIDLSWINLLPNLKTVILSFSHCGFREYHLRWDEGGCMNVLDLSTFHLNPRTPPMADTMSSLKLAHLEAWARFISRQEHNPGFKKITIFHRDDYRGEKDCGGGKWFMVEVKSRGKGRAKRVEGREFWTNRKGECIAEPIEPPVQGDEGYDKGDRVLELPQQ